MSGQYGKEGLRRAVLVTLLCMALLAILVCGLMFLEKKTNMDWEDMSQPDEYNGPCFIMGNYTRADIWRPSYM
jgi:hypothetical protein